MTSQLGEGEELALFGGSMIRTTVPSPSRVATTAGVLLIFSTFSSET